MPVELRNEQKVVPIDSRRFKETAELLLEQIGQPDSGLSILITDDRQMTQLHGEWMGEETPTDVLSFPQREGEKAPRGGPASGLLGDVVISAETAKRRAPKEPMREILFYLVHGLLHLTGHDHVKPAERQKMNKETARLLGLIRKRSLDGSAKS